MLWLSSKGYLQVEESKRTTIQLGEEGRRFLDNGLPERRLADAVMTRGGSVCLDDARSLPGLNVEYTAIAVGWARRKGWLTIRKEGGRTLVSIAESFPKGADERLIDLLSAGPVTVGELTTDLVEGLNSLQSRPNAVIMSDEVNRTLSLTDTGETIAGQLQGETIRTVSRLTPPLITSGAWRDLRFRSYDVEAPVAKIWSGKKQPYRRFLDDLKLKLLILGFKEMEGPLVEFMFFNCDALFMPQNHPAREIHDIYYVKRPSHGNLSAYSSLVERVKATHEDGWTTGSTGWGYAFSHADARRLILRSQTTASSARMLVKPELEVPGKYFSLARCYRPDVVDRTHLTEFIQVEGIVVGASLSFRDLLGILKRFAFEIADVDQVRFKPDYFPFTEPSVELSAYKEGLGWMEFGGAGIFRPEVTLPLGISVPVIAWGLGVERLFMMKAGISDIRNLFSQDLDWLRSRTVD
jgi:phenylalanyl-tRNA synthetase alpha chain